jgi:septal ring factor EnvC (AmiA/AmiB activator)
VANDPSVAGLGDWVRELVTGALVVILGWLFTSVNARRKAVDMRLAALEKGHSDQATILAVVQSCQENTRETLEKLEDASVRFDAKLDVLNENITRTLQASLDHMPGGKRRTD